MSRSCETIVIGGGQAGLAASFYLTQRGREHVVLERAAQAGNAWRNDRWDSFTLVTPNSALRLPGAEYAGNEPESFMQRDDVVAYFEQYVERFHLPVHYGQRVTAVKQNGAGSGYLVTTEDAAWQARNVVMATGLHQRPKMPASSKDLSPSIMQLHSGHYRNPTSLPPGAVLVVGSAQSGAQIVDELVENGRTVYLCIGSAGRAPRRYRGKDIYEWLVLSGFVDRTVDMLPSPKARFAGSAHVSGRAGGRTLNLHQFARDGVTLLGRLQGARDRRVWLAPDVQDSLAKADKFEVEIVKVIDGFILQSGREAPTENLTALRDGYDAPEIADLDLHKAGITTIIWAMGYGFDFRMVDLPIFDDAGYPIQQRGATDYPGMYFLGLPWLYKLKSGLLMGVGEDAEYIVSHMAGERKPA